MTASVGQSKLPQGRKDSPDTHALENVHHAGMRHTNPGPSVKVCHIYIFLTTNHNCVEDLITDRGGGLTALR
jgi:hypothetical protein